MNYKLIRLCLVLCFISNGLLAQKWSVEMYETYTFKRFYKSAIAQQIIDPDDIDYGLLNAAIFYASNEQRIKHGRQRFSYAPELEASASGHSFDMSKYDFFSHNSRVKGKSTPKHRMMLEGVKNTTMGENIATSLLLVLTSDQSYIPPSSSCPEFRYAGNGRPIPYRTYSDFGRDVVNDWMHSPGHRKNVLHRDFTRLGCGTYLKNEKKSNQVPQIISTQNFSGEYEVKAE